MTKFSRQYQISVASCSKAVSYTHLDVYKTTWYLFILPVRYTIITEIPCLVRFTSNKNTSLTF
ncbi:hypothetical protein AZZ76_005063 [Klebsiella pneumoniae]|nr:hypothetical protein AZZ76_005063 [Klebsiella pneumoniae]